MKTIKYFLVLMLFATVSFANDSDFESEFEDEFSQKKEVYDPLYNYNEAMTHFNDVIYRRVLNPTAEGYENVVHKNIRVGVNNAFENLFFPIRFINNLLQFKFVNTGEETLRFILNSTFGLLGLIDVGARVGLEQHDEDFGQTLGYYGVGAGPHIVWPFLGPSNLRDSFGDLGDRFVNPLSSYVFHEPFKMVDNGWESVGIGLVDGINKSSLDVNAYTNLTKDAVDLYPFLRDIYEQRREALIKE